MARKLITLIVVMVVVVAAGVGGYVLLGGGLPGLISNPPTPPPPPGGNGNGNGGEPPPPPPGGAIEIVFRTGDFTSGIFEVSSDTWQLWWEMTGGRGDESHFSYEIYEEGGVTPIDSWEVDADRFPGSSISGRSVDLAGPGRFFYKIDASPDFQWLVSIKEI